MSRIFISYRRQDTKYVVRYLSEKLATKFGPSSVFMDIDGIDPGDEFDRIIEKRVGQCDVLIACIGPDWEIDRSGVDRINDPDDWVRAEIATALRRDIRVIPVLVDRTTMPDATELPNDLRPLLKRNAVIYNLNTAQEVIRRLIITLEKQFQACAETVDAAPIEPEPSFEPDFTHEFSAKSNYRVRFDTTAEEKTLPTSKKIIGIDLGTTNSLVAVSEPTGAKVIAGKDGSKLTPSVVAFLEDDEVLVGETAKRQADLNPTRTIHSVKRFMGRRCNEIESEKQLVPYELTGRSGEYVKVAIGNQSISAPEISALVLRNLKKQAEYYLQERVELAVITVPAYFNDAQRSATKAAGEIAGFKVARIINEPTAASMACGTTDGETVVFDLGGGTLDVTVLEVDRDMGLYSVHSTCGNTKLGGDDFDGVLVNLIASAFYQKHRIDLRSIPDALIRLRQASENAKIELSSCESTSVTLPFICQTPTGPKHVQTQITRGLFEKHAKSLVDLCRIPVKQALKDANLRPEQIESVLLVGGSTAIPAIRNLVREIFGKEPMVFENAQELVALGAAVQGSIIAGEHRDAILVDVTPFTLGIETKGGVMSVLIDRNTTIPCERSSDFSTASNNQTKVSVRVYQGERPMVADNRLLGEFTLAGIPPAPRGVPLISVTFNIDVNGILTVSAKDKATGKEQSIQVEASGGLELKEIECLRASQDSYHLTENAPEFIPQNDEQRDCLDACNQAERLIQNCAGRVTEEDVATLRRAIEFGRAAIRRVDARTIRRCLTTINAESQKLVSKAYSSRNNG